MFPLISYQVVREWNEERVAKAGAIHWLRRAIADEAAKPPTPGRDADVIELVFGAHCEVEDAIA